MPLLELKKVTLSPKENNLSDIFQALGDKTRYKIFKLLVARQEMCVSEIAYAVGVSVPAVSQHFRIFETVGVVQKTRMGQKVCYEIKPSSLTDKITNIL